MSDQFADFEALLKRALSPVEPPKELEARLEGPRGSLVPLSPAMETVSRCRSRR